MRLRDGETVSSLAPVVDSGDEEPTSAIAAEGGEGLGESAPAAAFFEDDSNLDSLDEGTPDDEHEDDGLDDDELASE